MKPRSKTSAKRASAAKPPAGASGASLSPYNFRLDAEVVDRLRGYLPPGDGLSAKVRELLELQLRAEIVGGRVVLTTDVGRAVADVWARFGDPGPQGAYLRLALDALLEKVLELRGGEAVAFGPGPDAPKRSSRGAEGPALSAAKPRSDV